MPADTEATLSDNIGRQNSVFEHKTPDRSAFATLDSVLDAARLDFTAEILHSTRRHGTFSRLTLGEFKQLEMNFDKQLLNALRRARTIGARWAYNAIGRDRDEANEYYTSFEWGADPATHNLWLAEKIADLSREHRGQDPRSKMLAKHIRELAQELAEINTAEMESKVEKLE